MTLWVVMVAAALAQAPGPAGLSERGPRGDALDYGEKPSIPGFARWKGGCGDAFPFNLQHPAGWTVRGDRRAFQRERTADGTFLIRVSEDMGSVHVLNRIATLKQGRVASPLGTVTIGGQSVEVLGGGPRSGYLLFAPHPWGMAAVGYFELAVSSTFGEDLTMQILRSLEPVRCE
jgi:hypothetical protein